MAMVTGSTALPFSLSWLGIACTMSVCQKVSIISIQVHDLFPFCRKVLLDNTYNMICALHLYSCIVPEGKHVKTSQNCFHFPLLPATIHYTWTCIISVEILIKKNIYIYFEDKVKDHFVIWQTAWSVTESKYISIDNQVSFNA